MLPVVALFRMPYKIYWLLPITCISFVLLPMKQVLTVLFFNLYYLYCLSIFQRTCCFRFKSGRKGKGFIFNCQIFSEVFFIFSFQLVSQALLRKGKNNYKRKKQNRSLCESDCKDKNFMLYLPNFIGSFLFLLLSGLSLCH